MQSDIFHQIGDPMRAATGISMDTMRLLALLTMIIGVALFLYKVFIAIRLLQEQNDDWMARIAFLLTTLLLPYGIGALISDAIRVKSPLRVLAFCALAIGFGIIGGLTLQLLPHHGNLDVTLPNW